MTRKFLITLILMITVGGIASADEAVDLIGEDGGNSGAEASDYILDASWDCADPYGEFDPSLGAAAALNRALGLIFSGHASPEQIDIERQMADGYSGHWEQMAPFAVEVLLTLQEDFNDAFPEPVELIPFDLAPSRLPVALPDNPNLVAVEYNAEEYLERLLQRLYFKLIQGPVLLTVPYRADAPSVPEEYRNWNNFRYASTSDTMQWDDVRLVWVDWSLTQTVVLRYENGLIACYDSGNKYYIDHTAAVAAAGAMFAHPDLANLHEDIDLNYVLTTGD